MHVYNLSKFVIWGFNKSIYAWYSFFFLFVFSLIFLEWHLNISDEDDT